MTFRKLQIAATLLAATTLSGCGGGGSGNAGNGPIASPATISDSYQGTWVAEAYGWALEIGRSNLRLLDYSSEFCLTVAEEVNVDTDDVESLFRLRDDQLEWFANDGTPDFAAPGVLFTPGAVLPDSCVGGVDAVSGDPGYERNPQRELYRFAQLLDEYSIYPELRGVEPLLRFQELQSSIGADSNDAELAEALFQLALPFADIHTTVETSVGLVKILNKPSFSDRLVNEWLELEGVTPPLSTVEIDAANRYIAEQLELDRAITLSYSSDPGTIRQAANELLTWHSVDGIGYLAIDAMFGFGNVDDNEEELQALDDALDRALGDLRDVEALIIDVRRNGGGKDFLSLAIASRFVANETLVYAKQARLGNGRSELIDVFLSPRGAARYLGDVFLLTSPETASAAEVFTLAMRELPQVTLVGEATQGGLSDQLSKTLLNGWPVSVANEYYLSAQGDLFETLGIPVDVEVPQFTREARLTGRDYAIETVIELLGQVD